MVQEQDISLFGGRYRVLGLLRAGGMGTIYEVEDMATGRHRALKRMHPALALSADIQMRFQREVFIGAEIESEHIVEVVDAGIDAATQTPYLAMELLRGEDLSDRLRRETRLSPTETLTILAQVASGLDKAHSKGVVHRDLKPENVFLASTDDGGSRVKILDFGIAKLVSTTLPTATQAAGTPLYMAPEQTDPAASVSPATDLWALGLLAYRMLVGGSYWEGESIAQLYRQIVLDPIPSAVERAAARGVVLPAAFDDWFARLVVRDPHARLRDAGGAVTWLSEILGVAVERTIPPPPPHYSVVPDALSLAPTLAVSPLSQPDTRTPAPSSRPAGARWRDRLKSAIDDAATAMEHAHKEVARLPFAALQHVPKLAQPAKGAHEIHDAILGGTYEAIRLVNRVAGEVADAVSDKSAAAAAPEESSPPSEPSSSPPKQPSS
jgi:serine/threonine-protein kinase